MRYAAIILCALFLGACIPNRSYRANDFAGIPSPSVCAAVASSNVRLERGDWIVNNVSDGARKGYKLGFIEFDDFGEFRNRCQLQSVTDAIREAKKGPTHSVAVIVFVHGWKNNASDQSGNVWGFRDELQDVARNVCKSESRSERGCVPANVPVLGIYIGWRGDVARFGKNLTFWDRRDTATHVGGAHMTEALLEIINETKGPNYSDPSTCILAGHSFGGLLLEHALTQTLVNIIERQSVEQANKPNPSFASPVDLLVFINEAAPAIEAKRTLDVLQAHDVHLIREREYPLILSMTSESDLATKVALPGGQALSLPLNSLRTYPNPDQFGVTKQRSYYLQSTANMGALQSHRIGNANTPEIAAGYKAGGEFSHFEIGEETYRIVPIPNAKNRTAYWVMQIPQQIVPDHGTIFRKEFRMLLQSFLPAPAGPINNLSAPGQPASLRRASMKSQITFRQSH
jgi:pimeloyl-ACP methyl ester carboxylesterase